jgi:hypothetical protein
LKDYIPTIDDYYKRITGLIQNLVLLQIRKEVFEISLSNLKKIHQVLETKSKPILDKYQQVNEDVYNLETQAAVINASQKDFILFQNKVFRNKPDEDIINFMDKIMDHNNNGQTFLRYLIQQHGLVREV